MFTKVVIVSILLVFPVSYGIFQWLMIVNPIPIMVGLVVILAAIIIANQHSFFRAKGNLLLFIFYSSLLLGTLLGNSPEPYMQLVSLIVCFVWVSGFVSMNHAVYKKPNMNLAFKCITVLGYIVTLSVYASYFLHFLNIEFGEVVDRFGELRAFGPYGDQVGFVICYFVLRDLAKRRWYLGVFHAGAMILTGTRGAYISLAVGLVWLQLDGLRRKRGIARVPMAKYMVSAVAFSLIVVAILLSPLGEPTRRRLFEGDTLFRGIESRMMATKLGVQVFIDNPILGVGYLGFSRLVGRYEMAGAGVMGTNYERGTYTCQNQFIQTGTDGGVPAMIALLVLVLHVVRVLGRGIGNMQDDVRHEVLAIQSWLVAMAIGNQSAVWILPGAISGYLFFSLSGLGLGVVGLARDSSTGSGTLRRQSIARNRMSM